MLRSVHPYDIEAFKAVTIAANQAKTDDPYKIVRYAANSVVLRNVIMHNPELTAYEDLDYVRSRSQEMINGAAMQTHRLLGAAEAVIPSPLSISARAEVLRNCLQLGVTFGAVSAYPKRIHKDREMTNDGYVLQQITDNPHDYVIFADDTVRFTDAGTALLREDRDSSIGAGCPSLGQATNTRQVTGGRTMFNLFWRGFTEEFIQVKL